MTSSKEKKILTKVSVKGISWTHNQGYSWFASSIIPAINNASKDHSINRELVSDVWYVIGDINDFNDAPLKAIEAYKESLKYDSENAAAYREIASMYNRIGEYKTALRFINKSLKIDPAEQYAQMEKKETILNIKTKNEPLYHKGDMLWEMNELLANGKFEFVISCLKKYSDLEKLKVLARAYAALGMNAEYLKTWNSIITKNKKFSLDYADWFYMPDSLYENSKIWVIFKKAAKNINPSIFIQFDSLNKFYSGLSAENCLRIKCDYMIHKSKGNLMKLSKMSVRFPEWKELANYKV